MILTFFPTFSVSTAEGLAVFLTKVRGSLVNELLILAVVFEDADLDKISEVLAHPCEVFQCLYDLAIDLSSEPIFFKCLKSIA